jgi:hypothetical protein
MCLCIDYILVARLDGLHLSDILKLMLHFSMCLHLSVYCISICINTIFDKAECWNLKRRHKFVDAHAYAVIRPTG